MGPRRPVKGWRSAPLFPLQRVPRPDEPAAIEAQIAAAGLPTPTPEYQFCVDRRWRFDYAWLLFRLALEIEGGAHGRLIVIERGYERRKGQSVPIAAGTRIRVGGRHQTGPGMEGDMEKYNRAAIDGWFVLRATTRQIRDGIAIATLRAAFVARGLE